MSAIIKTGYQTPDGKIFETRAEAEDYLRLPKVTEALNALTGNNAELVKWLIDKEDEIRNGFSTESSARVTKAEKKALAQALDAIAETANKEFKFVIDNKDAIYNSFRWPTVKRLKPEEQEAKAKETFAALTGNNAELTTWIIGNKQALLDALDAGKIKREVSEKATTALEEYRQKVEQQKAAALGLTVEAYRAKREADKAKEEADKEARRAAKAKLEASLKP